MPARIPTASFRPLARDANTHTGYNLWFSSSLCCRIRPSPSGAPFRRRRRRRRAKLAVQHRPVLTVTRLHPSSTTWHAPLPATLPREECAQIRCDESCELRKSPPGRGLTRNPQVIPLADRETIRDRSRTSRELSPLPEISLGANCRTRHSPSTRWSSEWRYWLCARCWPVWYPNRDRDRDRDQCRSTRISSQFTCPVERRLPTTSPRNTDSTTMAR